MLTDLCALVFNAYSLSRLAKETVTSSYIEKPNRLVFRPRSEMFEEPTDLANLRFEALAVAQGLADKSALAPEEKQALIGALRVEYTGVSAQHVALQHARNAAVDGRPDGIEDAVWTAQLKAEFDDPVQALEDVMQVLRDQVAELRA